MWDEGAGRKGGWEGAVFGRGCKGVCVCVCSCWYRRRVGERGCEMSGIWRDPGGGNVEFDGNAPLTSRQAVEPGTTLRTG